MSTEHQQYSTANQSVAILQYAAQHNMEIIRTYADHGKSGVSLATRGSLQRLLKDAVALNAEFKAVLVYDVSRWGRFQNPDEGAVYEYSLQKAGIPVHYCAEPFANDGSLASAILKTLKRGMAGEYSRELSVKVWAGHRRITELGYKIGGYAGYGLRRQLLGRDGTPKQVLKLGERKSLQSEHVILIPGPHAEIEIIHRIYEMYIDRLMTEREIAKELNGESIPWIGSRPWTRMCIRHILQNPKYVGASVYNRTSRKLQSTPVRNPRSEWIWRDGAFEPVVPKGRFEQAREIAERRALIPTPEKLLADLKQLVSSKGRLSERLIDSTEGMARAGSYIRHFGSLRNAYRLAGWKPEIQLRHLHREGVVRQTHGELIEQLREALSEFAPKITILKGAYLVTTGVGIVLSLVPTRCSLHQKKYKFWYVYARENIAAHFRLVVRLTEANNAVMDYFIFPDGIIKNSRLTLGRVNAAAQYSVYRFESLDVLVRLLRHSEMEGIRLEDFAHPPTPKSNQTRRVPRLADIQIVLGRLIVDEDFRNVMRAEHCSKVPDVLCHRDMPLGEQLLAVVVCEAFVARLLNNAKVRGFIERRHSPLLKQLRQ
jgi:DNA invertase Pin-like site-specific DNA recombinase